MYFLINKITEKACQPGFGFQSLLTKTAVARLGVASVEGVRWPKARLARQRATHGAGSLGQGEATDLDC